MSKSGFRDSPPAPSCAVNSCYRLDQLNLRMVGCKVVLWNEMISYSCFATLMRSFKSLKQAFYQHEDNSTSSDDLMDACFVVESYSSLVEEICLENREAGNTGARVRILLAPPAFSWRAYIIPVPYHRLKGMFYCELVMRRG